MRGRTNTNLYSGISLNANVRSCVVKENSIAAGDFVEYTTTLSGALDVSTTSSNLSFLPGRFLEYLSDNRIFCVANGYAFILKNNGNTIEKDEVAPVQLLDNASDLRLAKGYKIDKDTFVLIYPSLDSSSGDISIKFLKFDVDTNILYQRKQSLNLSSDKYSTAYYDIMRSKSNNLEFYVAEFCTASSNSKTYRYDMLSVILLSGSNYDNFKFETKYYRRWVGSEIITSKSYAGVKIINATSDGEKILISYTSVYVNTIVYVYDINSNEFAKLISYSEQPAELLESNNGYVTLIGSGPFPSGSGAKGKIIILRFYTTDFTPDNLTKFDNVELNADTGYRFCYDGQGPNVTLIDYTQYKSRYYIRGLTRLTSFAGYVSFRLVIEVDKSDGTVTEYQNIIGDIDKDNRFNKGPSYLLKIQEENKFFVLETFEGCYYELMIYDFSDNIPKTDIRNITEVKRIEDKQYIMGVARDSGNVGSTIGVYVPLTNY